MPMDADVLVDAYLGRLDAAAARLPVDRRAELVAEVREHIATALAEADRRDETTVRNVLERLGSPEDIVAAEAAPDAFAAGSSSAQPQGPIDGRPPWGANETAAVLLLTVGAVFLPFVGPLLGLVLVWLSARWTRPLKSLVTLVVVIVFVVVPIFGLYAWAVDAGEQSVETAPIIQVTPVP
jgi:uncharacterized membrane protein